MLMLEVLVRFGKTNSREPVGEEGLVVSTTEKPVARQ